MCKGKLNDGYAAFTAEIDQCVIVIKNVPALVCEQCGEVSYSDNVARRLQQIVNSLKEMVVPEIAVVTYTEKAA
jgi:YgiT-type zinc finger domain-containing protein